MAMFGRGRKNWPMQKSSHVWNKNVCTWWALGGEHGRGPRANALSVPRPGPQAKPPPPSCPLCSSRMPHAYRRCPEIRRAAAPFRTSGRHPRSRHPFFPAAHRRSGPFRAASCRNLQIGRGRFAFPGSWDLTGGVVAAPGASGVALRLPSTTSGRPPSAEPSFVRPVSQPRTFLPPPLSGPLRTAGDPHPFRSPSSWQYRPLPPPSSCYRPVTCHLHIACYPGSGRPPLFPLPPPPPPASRSCFGTSPRVPAPLAVPQLAGCRTMSEGGDDPFCHYSQPDTSFSTSQYPPPLPFSTPALQASGSQTPAHGLSGFNMHDFLGTSSASAAHRGMAGSVPDYFGTSISAAAQGSMAGSMQGYSGYCIPSGHFQMPQHSSILPMAGPARHSISSLPTFQGGPYSSLRTMHIPAVPPVYGDLPPLLFAISKHNLQNCNLLNFVQIIPCRIIWRGQQPSGS
jgi:hypothetical protein